MDNAKLVALAKKIARDSSGDKGLSDADVEIKNISILVKEGSGTRTVTLGGPDGNDKGNNADEGITDNDGSDKGTDFDDTDQYN